MSVMAIGPVSYVNAASLVNTPEPQAQTHQQNNAQLSPSGAAMAVQAFMAFQPDVQPIASLNPANETEQALPVEANDDFNGSTPEWTGAVVDVYA